jgi:serine beta-lactamase-like protein LACTB, mitochondrial
MNLRIAITICFILLINCGGLAQDHERELALPTQLEALVEAQFPPTRCPGLSVAVASNNKVAFSKAFGLAELEQRVPLTAQSAHRLASLSKPVTGTIIMELIQGQRLSLDVSVREYLPELPDRYSKVTIRHLLSHQSGVRDYRDLEEVFSVKHYKNSREAISIFVNDRLLFEPGTKVEYSSYNFTLLGAVIEGVTGENFQQIAKDFFLRHGIAGFSLDDALEIVPLRVRGYRVDESGQVENARFYDASNKYPAGGFVASAENYLRFVLATASGRVLPSSTVREMWTQQSLNDGKTTPFGLGWGVSDFKGYRMLGYNGLQPGETTTFRFFPQLGFGVVLACNAEGTENLDKLLDSILAVGLPSRK